MTSIQTIPSTDFITNSRADINQNFANLNSDKIETSYLDTDTTLSANSDTKIATQKAVKAYVDAGGNPNASTTAKGIVQEATAAEVVAKTAVGSTGARLFVNPSTLPSFAGGTGDGSDGALNVTSGTTNINAASANVVVKNYTTGNISAGATLGMTNPATDGTTLVLRFTGDCTIAGTIDLRLMGSAGGAGGSPGNDGTEPYSHIILASANSTARGKGATGSAGGAGGAFPIKAQYTSNNFYLSNGAIRISTGAGGGGGDSGNTGTGGRGGGALIIVCGGTLTFTGTINTSGANGSNGTGSQGGGGGGSAGMGVIFYSTLLNSGTFTATGGNGGSGSGGGSHGGGGAGSVIADGGAGGTTTGSAAGGAGAGGGGGGSSTGGNGGATMSLLTFKL